MLDALYCCRFHREGGDERHPCRTAAGQPPHTHFLTRFGILDLGERPDGEPWDPQVVDSLIRTYEKGWQAGRDSLEGEFNRGVWHGVIVSAAVLVLAIILRLARTL